MMLDVVKMYAFFVFKIPFLIPCLPRLSMLNNERCVLKIPLYFMTKNHLGSMYFGALMVGVDLACGLLAFHHIRHVDEPVSIVFKDVQAQFLKRAEGRVRFECVEGQQVAAMIAKTIKTGDRVSEGIVVKGYDDVSNECVVDYVITLSVRVKRPS